MEKTEIIYKELNDLNSEKIKHYREIENIRKVEMDKLKELETIKLKDK